MQDFANVDMLFPEVIQGHSLFSVFTNEVKKSHRWASLCFRYDADYPRSWRFLFLASTVNCMVFVSTLLFNWVQPHSALCGGFQSAEDCLREPSKLAAHESMCYWDHGEAKASCQYSEATNHADLTMLVAAMSGLLSIPLILVLESIAIHLLCRPVHKSGQITPSLLDEDITDTWSTRDSLGQDGVVSAAFSWLRHLFRKRSTVGVDSDIDDKLLHNVTSDLRQLVYDLSLYRKKLRRKHVPVFDAYWGFTPKDTDYFLQEISCHPYLASSSGCSDGDDRNEVAVKKPQQFGSSCSFVNKNVVSPSFHCRGFTQLWNELLQARVKTQSEIEFLQNSSMTDKARGERIFMLFKQDLLQGIQSEVMSILVVAQSTSSITQTLLRNRTPISEGRRLAGVVLFVGINAVLMMYILLFSLHQVNSSDRLRAFAVWIAVEILIVSTVSLFISHIITPLFALADLKQIQQVLRSAATKLFEPANDNCKPSDFVMREREHEMSTVQPVFASDVPFNTAPYLFVSRRLVEQFPELPESGIVEQFRSVIPNRPYSAPQGQMYGYRVLLR
mgnify:FL=1